MNTYILTQDLLDTYQSMSDFMQLMWLAGPLIFLATLFYLVLQYRLARKRDAHQWQKQEAMMSFSHALTPHEVMQQEKLGELVEHYRRQSFNKPYLVKDDEGD